jgi:hypothetical protein
VSGFLSNLVKEVVEGNAKYQNLEDLESQPIDLFLTERDEAY